VEKINFDHNRDNGGSCKHGNQTSSSMNDPEFDYLSDSQFLEKASMALSSLIITYVSYSLLKQPELY
jgi:hypothetical protein